MELGLQFEDEDLTQESSTSKKDRESHADYTPKECFPEWFDKNGSLDVDCDINEVKFGADIAFAKADYERSRDLYQTILPRTKGMAMVRDVIEGLARSWTQLGNHQKALDWAIKLHQTSHSNNPDHNTVSLNLLAIVYHNQKEYAKEAASLAGVIQYHPLLPDTWARFGRAYAKIADINSKECQLVAAVALARSRLLLKSVERTVSGFVLEKNQNLQSQLLQEIKILQPDAKIRESIETILLNKIRFEFDEMAPTSSEFEDWGRSARLKSIEDSYKNVEMQNVESQTTEANSVSLPSLESFKQKWFSFVEEIK